MQEVSSDSSSQLLEMSEVILLTSEKCIEDSSTYWNCWSRLGNNERYFIKENVLTILHQWHLRCLCSTNQLTDVSSNHSLVCILFLHMQKRLTEKILCWERMSGLELCFDLPQFLEFLCSMSLLLFQLLPYISDVKSGCDWELYAALD